MIAAAGISVVEESEGVIGAVFFDHWFGEVLAAHPAPGGIRHVEIVICAPNVVCYHLGEAVDVAGEVVRAFHYFNGGVVYPLAFAAHIHVDIDG